MTLGCVVARHMVKGHFHCIEKVCRPWGGFFVCSFGLEEAGACKDYLQQITDRLRRSTTAHAHIGTSANAQPCVGSSFPQRKRFAGLRRGPFFRSE